MPLVVSLSLVLTGCGPSSTASAPSRSSTSSSTAGTSASGTVYRFGVVGNAGKIAQLQLDSPTVVTGVIGRIVQIATSNSDGYALTSTGEVWTWGVDSAGELGDGTRSAYETVAVRVEFPAGVRIASLPNPMPFDGALAIDTTRHVWGWGLNGAGDLCLPGSVYTRPYRIGLTDVTVGTGARTHSLFYSNGRVYACGSGDAGELGDGSTTSTGSPVRVVDLPAGVEVMALTSSWEGSGALLANGDYYDWGYNPGGQLGDGNESDSSVPERVHLPGAVKTVFQGGSGAGNGQTIAVSSDGSVWAWGDNQRGQLGDGTLQSSDTPVRVHVPSGVNFVEVGSGGYSSYAIDSTGTLWAWGGDENGQLGLGTSLGSDTVPTKVGIHLVQVSSTASNVAGLAG